MENEFLEKYRQQNLRKCQLKQLTILMEFDKICKNNKIDYWIDGGSLLGAVRHGGFIPWDDDIDIGMTVDEYKKFCNVINELPSHLFFQTSKTDNTWSPVPKIRDLNSLYIEPLYSFRENYQKGIYIDIFPKTLYPSCKPKLLKIILKNISKSYSILHEKHTYNLKSFVEFFYFGFLYIINFSIWKILNLVCKKNKYIGDTPPLNGQGYVHTYDAIFPLKKIKFEGYEFSCPNNPDLYLKEQYGNYMEIPPKEKQQIHGIFYQPELIPES